jgi:hypothetical protein
LTLASANALVNAKPLGDKVLCKAKFITEIFKTQTPLYQRVADMIVKNWDKQKVKMTKTEIKSYGKTLLAHIVKTGAKRPT